MQDDYPSNVALDSCFIWSSRSRSLPSILFRGDGVNQILRVWHCHSYSFISAPRPSTPLAKRHNERGTGKGVFLAMILDLIHATCHAGHSQPEWIFGSAKHAAKTDRLCRSPYLRLKCIPDASSWLDLISGLDCNLLIALTPAVSD
jgi:hypothetical protein